MGLIVFDVTGPLKGGIRFDVFPDTLREDLLTEIESLGREAFARVAAGVPHLTGRLASQEELEIVNEPGRVAAIVDFGGDGAESNDFAKAGALEYGSTGKSHEVQPHLMTITEAFGRLLDAPMTRITKQFSRTPDITADFFVRGAMAGMQNEIIDRLNAVVSRAEAALIEE